VILREDGVVLRIGALAMISVSRDAVTSVPKVRSRRVHLSIDQDLELRGC